MAPQTPPARHPPTKVSAGAGRRVASGWAGQPIETISVTTPPSTATLTLLGW